PRLGNHVFSRRYDELVPETYRIECDGDVVTGVPKAWYKHVGQNILVDGTGSGMIIVEP
ncbi:unnamed protein product, partial [Heterosigma akashiwo]